VKVPPPAAATVKITISVEIVPVGLAAAGAVDVPVAVVVEPRCAIAIITPFKQNTAPRERQDGSRGAVRF